MAGGLSQNGAEGLGGAAQGFEIQGQGVTRRAPGEGPKVDGGRAQPQELDSYDQPQYEGLEKASEEEHEEHPWMTKKQAKRVAQDHMRLGKMTEVFRIKGK